MPQIKEYSQRTQAPSPISGPSSFQDTSGAQGMQMFGKVTQDAADRLYQYRAEKDKSWTSAEVAKLNENYAYKQKELANKEYDPEATQKMMDSYKEDSAKIKDGIHTAAGREYFDSIYTSSEKHLFDSTLQTQSYLAGEKSKNEKKTELQSASNAAYATPSMAPTLRDNLKKSIYSSTFYTRPIADKLWEESNADLTQSEVRGWINIDPADTRSKLEKGVWKDHLTVDQTKALISEAKRREKENREEFEHNIRFNEYKKNLEDNASALKLSEKLGDNTLTPSDVRKAGLHDFRIYEHFMSAIKADKFKKDSGVYSDLYRRILLEDGDPEQITSSSEITAYLPSLGPKLTGELLTSFSKRKTVDGNTEAQAQKIFLEKQLKPLIVKGPLGVDPVADTNYGKAVAEFNQLFNKGRKEGIPVKELLSLTGPNSLYPSLLKYRMTVQDAAQSLQYRYGNEPSALPPTPEAKQSAKIPRQPNETPAQYLERIKGAKQ